ncbi:hypothetical protein BJX70DRAFT_393122 [Aspergillus crustosus]
MIFRGPTVTRSHKVNDRDHAVTNNAVNASNENLPRYFAKSGPVDADPRKTKKNGGGKGNWGRSGEEVQDYGYTFLNTRRHSNSSIQGIPGIKTKFETVEPEPVFEENLHGPATDTMIEGNSVVKITSASSGISGISGMTGDSEVENATDPNLQ